MKKLIYSLLFCGITFFSLKLNTFALVPDVPSNVIDYLDRQNTNNYSVLVLGSYSYNDSLYISYRFIDLPVPCQLYAYKYYQSGISSPMFSVVCISDTNYNDSRINQIVNLDLEGRYPIDNYINVIGYMKYYLRKSVNLTGATIRYAPLTDKYTGLGGSYDAFPSGDTQYLPIYVRANNEWSTIPIFESAQALYNYLNMPPSEYDSELVISSPRLSGMFLSNAYNVLFCSCKGNENIDKIVLTVKCGGESVDVELDRILNTNTFINSVGLSNSFPNAQTGDDLYFYLTGYDVNGNYSNTYFTKGKFNIAFNPKWKEDLSGSFDNSLNVNGLNDVSVGVDSTIFYNSVQSPNEYTYNIDNSTSNETTYFQVFDITENTNTTLLTEYITNNIYNITNNNTTNNYYNVVNDYSNYTSPDGYYNSPLDYLNDLNSSKKFVFDIQSQTLDNVNIGDNIFFFTPLIVALTTAIVVIIVAFVVALIVKFIDIIWP